ncbi:uncharacterized protein SCHCODRAFT_02694132 [Schizophyllum commune H4-8]|uniref:uncharacterized protein n=1 Tax=Schizophyllum commune (strain H4-8 / FGSC 9210) TaxID=578458 RepID=UPI002160D830|nr:uncharacterized protein SCHCODRAFT_02694132 [Schizophyllum commune H4-8]KAI5885130.1 hypothetical protein SCHCODRAFT_02694132 [Schizophyllum commune H4-8]
MPLFSYESGLCATCKACMHVRAVAIPKCRERFDIERKLAMDATSLAAYDDAILRVQQTLESLKSDRKALEESMSTKRAMLAPIRRPPNEIFTMIISFAIFNACSSMEDSVRIFRHSVFRVCQRWRDLGFAASPVWSKITLFPHVYTDWDDMMRLCLERSKAHPLDIYLSSGRRSTKPGRYSWSDEITLSNRDIKALHDLVACSTRWRCVRLGTFRFPDEILKRETPLSLPQLTSLFLEKPYYVYGVPGTGRFKVPLSYEHLFSDAPALKNVRIERHEIQHLRLPWSHLTRLYIARNLEEDVEHWLTALRQCHSLRSLTLEDTLTTIKNGTQPIILPCLQDLDLRTGAWGILPYLCAPMLQAVKLERVVFFNFSEIEPHPYLEALKRCVLQSGTRVSRLSLEVTAYDGVVFNWKEIFEPYHSTLTHLAIKTSPKAMYSLICTLAAKPDVLPHLTLLTLPEFKIDTEKAFAAMVQLIDSRAILEEIEVYPVEGYAEYLDRLQKSSLAIYFRPTNWRSATTTERARAEEETWIMDPVPSTRVPIAVWHPPLQ